MITLEQIAIRQWLSNPAPYMGACGCLGPQVIIDQMKQLCTFEANQLERPPSLYPYKTSPRVTIHVASLGPPETRLKEIMTIDECSDLLTIALDQNPEMKHEWSDLIADNATVVH